MEIVEGLFDTFGTRRDAFAVQTKEGYYMVRGPLTASHILSHLKGEVSLGVYLLSEQNTARYTVIDADDQAGWEGLLKVHEDFPSYLETSRRGGHLWFFLPEVPGKLAKNFGLEIAKRYMIEAEVYPKQAESMGPGSCIRLPFGVHLKSGERYPFVGLGNWRAQLEALSDPKRLDLETVMSYQYEEPKREFKRPPLNGELPLWEKVKQQITVVELVGEYVELRRGVGHCPFHDDQHPSFSVNEKENYWNCFAGCGGGSVIDFWMKLTGLEFKDAVTDLAERLGLK